MKHNKLKTFSRFLLDEEIPANNVGSGNIAGLPPNEPTGSLPKKSKIARRKKPKR